MNQRKQLARFRANLQTEIDTGFLYEVLANAESRADIAAVYRNLVREEQGHAGLWRAKFAELGVAPPDLGPSPRARFMGWIARRLGPQFVLPTLIEAEQQMGFSARRAKHEHGARMTGGEDSHGRLLEAIVSGPGGGLDGNSLAQLEGRHRGAGGNALRAAVLGANDGLVSNMSLVMGVAGAAVSNSGILIAGFAGLLAGSISMALGEWLSVQSSRELYARQIEIESEELELSPESEARELALIYQAKGLPPDMAETLAHRLMADKSVAIDTLAREELGIDPDELGGSAWVAAITSFLLFALGAILPVLPFLLLRGAWVVPASLLVSALGLFGIGASITLLTGRNVLYSGVRQMLFGLTAAAVTYGIGHLLGVAIAG